MMDLTVNVISVGTGGILVIEFFDDGFTGLPPGVTGFFGAVGGNSVGTIDYEALIDDVPAITPYAGTSLGKLTGLGGFPFSGSFSKSGGPGASPYGLTQILTIEHTGAGMSSVDAALSAVPEPGTVLLLGFGLLGLGLYGRKRRKS